MNCQAHNATFQANPLTGIIWLTTADTQKCVGVPLSKLRSVEQKQAGDGTAVALYFHCNREVRINESYAEVCRLIISAAKSPGSPASRISLIW